MFLSITETIIKYKYFYSKEIKTWIRFKYNTIFLFIKKVLKFYTSFNNNFSNKLLYISMYNKIALKNRNE